MAEPETQSRFRLGQHSRSREGVRCSAIRALSSFPDDATFLYLDGVINRQESPELLVSALETMVVIRPEQAIARVLGLLETSNREINERLLALVKGWLGRRTYEDGECYRIGRSEC